MSFLSTKLFIIIIFVILGFLLYKEFTRTSFNTIEKFNLSDAGIIFDNVDNIITFNNPVKFKSHIDCDNIRLGDNNFSIKIENNDFVIRNNMANMKDTRISLGANGNMAVFNKGNPVITTNNTNATLKNLNITDDLTVNTNIKSTSNAGIVIDKPVKLTNSLDCNNIRFGDNKFGIQMETDHLVIRNNNPQNGDTRFAMNYGIGNYSMTRNGKNILNAHTNIDLGDPTTNVSVNNDLNVGKNLYVGSDSNKWHMRDTRLGITGKFDLVPGFTAGSNFNDNWIRMLNYGSVDANNYFSNGGFASDRLWTNKEAWFNTKVNLPLREYKCANEHGVCNTGVDGRIVYSQDHRRNQSSTRTFNPGQPVPCNNATFGDPIFGVVKSCYTYSL